MRLYFILLFCTCVSCKSGHVISEQQFETFRTTQSPGNFSRLRQDGVFNNTTKARQHEEYINKIESGLPIAPKGRMVFCPEIFFANGAFVTNGPVFSKEDVLQQYKNDHGYDDRLQWGAYEINGDTITVLVYRLFRNDFRLPRWENKIATYRGYILNDTTIVDWRQVPPYPSRDKQQLDTVAQRLEFYYFPEKRLIDSNRVFSKS